MAIYRQPPDCTLVCLARYFHIALQPSLFLMARSIHISTARTMLNSGDPVDIRVSAFSACRLKPVRGAEGKTTDRKSDGSKHYSICQNLFIYQLLATY